MGKDPVFGNDFYPLSQRAAKDDIPDGWEEDAEFGLALKGIFRRLGPVAVLGAVVVYNDQAHVEIEKPSSLSGGSILVRRHARLDMFGLSTNIARGNWLFKAEAAYIEG